MLGSTFGLCITIFFFLDACRDFFGLGWYLDVWRCGRYAGEAKEPGRMVFDGDIPDHVRVPDMMQGRAPVAGNLHIVSWVADAAKISSTLTETEQVWAVREGTPPSSDGGNSKSKVEAPIVVAFVQILFDLRSLSLSFSPSLLSTA